MKNLIYLAAFVCASLGAAQTQRATNFIATANVSAGALTSGRVVYAGASGILSGAAAFTFNSGTGALSATSFEGIGAFTTVTSSGIVALNGATASSSTSLIVPASSTTVSSLRIPHGSAPTSPVNGDVWTTTSGLFGRINGSTVGPLAAGGGSGTVSSGTTNTLSKYTAATTVGNSLFTDDGTTGGYTGAGGFSVSTGSGEAGGVAFLEGTAVAAPTDSVGFQAPTNVTTPFMMTLPSAPVTGFMLSTGTSDPSVISFVAGSGTGNVVRATYADAQIITNTAPGAMGNLTGTINIDWATSNNFYGTLTGNTTFTFSNATAGQFVTVDVAQTGTNTYTVTWPSAKWPAGTAPVMTAGSATSDITTIWYVNSVYKGSSNQNIR